MHLENRHFWRWLMCYVLHLLYYYRRQTVYPYTIHLLYIRGRNQKCNTNANSVSFLYTIGNKQCGGTLFDPYSLEEPILISVILYIPL